MKVVNSGAEALYVVQNGAFNGEVAKQVKELGLSLQLFGMYGTESSDLIEVGGDSLNGFFYTYTIDGSNLTPAQQDFKDKFESIVGGEPQASAYHAYDIYALLSEAIYSCSEPYEAGCLREYIENNGVIEGVSGRFWYEDGKVKRDLYLKTVEDGELVMWK